MRSLYNGSFNSCIKAKAESVNNAVLIAETFTDKWYWLISAFHSPCDVPIVEHRWLTRWVFPCASVLLCCTGKLCIEWTRENWLPSHSAVRFSVPETHDVTMGVTLWRAVCVKQACWCMKDVGFFFFFSTPPLEVWTSLTVYASCSIDVIQCFYLINSLPHKQKLHLQRQHRVILL